MFGKGFIYYYVINQLLVRLEFNEGVITLIKCLKSMGLYKLLY